MLDLKQIFKHCPMLYQAVTSTVVEYEGLGPVTIYSLPASLIYHPDSLPAYMAKAIITWGAVSDSYLEAYKFGVTVAVGEKRPFLVNLEDRFDDHIYSAILELMWDLLDAPDPKALIYPNMFKPVAFDGYAYLVDSLPAKAKELLDFFKAHPDSRLRAFEGKVLPTTMGAVQRLVHLELVTIRRENQIPYYTAAEPSFKHDVLADIRSRYKEIDRLRAVVQSLSKLIDDEGQDNE